MPRFHLEKKSELCSYAFMTNARTDFHTTAVPLNQSSARTHIILNWSRTFLPNGIRVMSKRLLRYFKFFHYYSVYLLQLTTSFVEQSSASGCYIVSQGQPSASRHTTQRYIPDEPGVTLCHRDSLQPVATQHSVTSQINRMSRCFTGAALSQSPHNSALHPR